MRLDLGYGRKVYKSEDIANAESLEELVPHLCHKSHGDETDCIDCPDRHCAVGIRVREIIDRMTEPDRKPEALAEDQDCMIYRNLLDETTLTPVYNLIKTAEKALSFHPKHFTRKDAIGWLEEMHARHPEIKTKRTLEDALKGERLKDYNRYLESISPNGVGEKRNTQLTANLYQMRYNEAGAYIKELKREFGNALPSSPRENRTAGGTEDAAGSWQERYEQAMTEIETLNERYEERMDEIGEEIQVLDSSIEFYTKVISQIKTTEKRLEFSKTIPIAKRIREIEEDEEYE